MEELEISTKIGLLAFSAGLIFGATANKTNFCTMGAISDMVLMGEKTRFRAWMLAIAVAILGTQYMASQGMIDIDHTLVVSDAANAVGYRGASFGWAGAILGGLMFGFGMTRGGGCGNKTLVRIGGGNLKSIVTFLVMGVVAYMTLRGIIALGRVELEAATNINLGNFEITSQGMDTLLAHLTGLDASLLRWVLVAVFSGGLAIYCFKDHEFRSSPSDMAAGLIIGALIPTAWYISGVAAFDDFEPTPLVSFTFIAPSADTIQYLMTFTGATINFGIAAVFGVIAGSFLVSIVTRSFHLEGFSSLEDTASTMWGAVLMGIGGVIALGCTIGQGLAGMSTLALGSLIATASIIIGGIWGMKSLEEGSIIGGLKAIFSRD